MVQEAEKLKNNCPLSLVVNSITMILNLPSCKFINMYGDMQVWCKIDILNKNFGTVCMGTISWFRMSFTS